MWSRVGAWTGTLKTQRNVYGVGSPTVGPTSSVRMHIYNFVACDVKHQYTHSLSTALTSAPWWTIQATGGVSVYWWAIRAARSNVIFQYFPRLRGSLSIHITLVSFCYWTNIYSSNSKMIQKLYYCNTEYTTKVKTLYHVLWCSYK